MTKIPEKLLRVRDAESATGLLSPVDGVGEPNHFCSIGELSFPEIRPKMTTERLCTSVAPLGNTKPNPGVVYR
uniref:Uncharacterized protein n=1 Tax=Arundo donax TaxID=35708 RepID=A0A0A9GMK7_ARUDO